MVGVHGHFTETAMERDLPSPLLKSATIFLEDTRTNHGDV